MTAGKYERELLKILSGKKKTLVEVTKSCSGVEKENYFKISENPFAVVRAAGSLGVDLVAIRGDISFLTEVKTSLKDTLHFSSNSGKLQRQAESMLDICKITKTLPVYAFRLKGYRGDSWRFFTINFSNLEGRIKILHRRLPNLEESKNGNFVMRWKEGMPLSEFISYIS
ncbi:MAG: Holliday junction resolvase [Candidatus Thermoplasmatota archaeon]